MTDLHTPLEDFYITMPEMPSQTAVEEYVASSNAKASGDPFWAVVCVLLGSGLSVAAGTFLLTMGILL